MLLEDLDAEHFESLRQCLVNLLSTQVAELTYAQIVDGLPLASVYADDHWFHDGLPVMEHEELCPGVLEKTQRLRSEFDILSLTLQPEVKYPFQFGLIYLSQLMIKFPDTSSISRYYIRLCSLETPALGVVRHCMP